MKANLSSTLAALAASAVALAGCGSSSAKGGPADSAAVYPPLPATFAVTADWLEHKLSLVDFAALAKGAATRQDVLLGEVDLSAYSQGPFSVKLTPDGKTALVSMSAGFFSVPGAGILVGASSIPKGPSKLLFVDLASRSITAELDTGDGATGIAITHDGTRAFVAHASTSNVSIIDVKARTILEQVDVGGIYAEEVALDDSDTVGVVTYVPTGGTEKSVRTFAVADMAGTLSPPIDLGTDAAGVPFFPGTKTAYVVLSYNPLTSPASGYALIDASNPSAPVKLVQNTWTDATYIDYNALAVPGRGSVLVPVASNGRLALREYGLGQGDIVLENTFDVTATKLFGAFGLVIDPQNHAALTLPGEREIAVIDLGTQATFTVPWSTQAAPTGIALH